MTIESVGKLRDYASRNQRVSGWMTAINRIADEIEREIAEKYQLLPVDADGVPIHVHDWIEVDDKKQRVAAVATGSVFWWEEDGCHWRQSFMCRYVKPRTIEDVLRDLVDGIGSVEFDALTAIGEAADEIRELMEVDR